MTVGTVKAAIQGRPTRALQTEPRWDLLTPVIAIDTEHQDIIYQAGERIKKAPGRVSIVNSNNQVICDVFVHFYDEDVHFIGLPHKKYGVLWTDIDPKNGARPIAEVEYYVRLMIEGRIVVGHAIQNDKKVFSTWVFDGIQTRDTQLLAEYCVHGLGADMVPSLSILSKKVLGRVIRGVEHSSVEDAQATMELYLRRKQAFEASQGTQSKLIPTDETAVVDSKPSQLPTREIDTPVAPVSQKASASVWQTRAEKIKTQELLAGKQTSFHRHQASTSSTSSSTSLFSQRSATGTVDSPAPTLTPPTEVTSPSIHSVPTNTSPTPGSITEALVNLQIVSATAHVETSFTASGTESAIKDKSMQSTKESQRGAKVPHSNQTTSIKQKVAGEHTSHPGVKRSWAAVQSKDLSGAKSAIGTKEAASSATAAQSSGKLVSSKRAGRK